MALHIAQAVIIFVSWAVTIAIFTQSSTTDGRTKWFFTLCWLSIPALIYLTMVPMWSRARRFANAYAYAAIDTVFAIFWLSAAIAVATWNSSGESEGAKKKKKSDASCATFAYGSETTCKLSKVTVGFGVVVFIFFAVTAAISIYGAIYYRKNGTLPGDEPQPHDPNSIENQTKDAFSTNTFDDDDNDIIKPGHVSAHEGDDYAPLHQNEADDYQLPSRRPDWQPEPYSGGYGDLHSAEEDRIRGAASVEPDGFAPSGHVHFPDADYSYRGAGGA
ncbi:hypothetical protein L228DRAFT_251198 [Xylona heveae TC161]|uniref:MARVEL domain-containing protein n=1 Tax=Xylona heveae (strain CBS 132557 / TC161) TaxID=1328760 RepID=A0A164ZHH5_XYLHT|nr:hypothetical protein L228DRAFT_251198 [Xylona heveae TC161]KZF19110.1 hypothetical protein L228DRAFT_251198 [Xylona heveae TC161]